MDLYRNDHNTARIVNYYKDQGQREPLPLRTAWWVNPLGALILIMIGVTTGWSAVTWALLVVIGGLTLAAQRVWRRTGRKWNYFNIIGLALVMVFITTACSATYTSAPGPAYPPQVVGMRFAGDPYSTDCAAGIATDGSGVVVGAFSGPWTGALTSMVVAWIGYQVFDAGGPTLAACWNELTWNGGAIQLYYQCAGTPVLDQAFNSYSEVTQFIHIPLCYSCNIACQGMANVATPNWNWDSHLCTAVDIDFRCAIQNGQWTSGLAATTASTSGPQPLPNAFALPTYPPQPPKAPDGSSLIQSQWQAAQLSNPIAPAPGPHATRP